jgi:hypothetical protein
VAHGDGHPIGALELGHRVFGHLQNRHLRHRMLLTNSPLRAI